MKSSIWIAGITAASLFSAASGFAQDASDTDLRVRQESLFAAMLQDPDNLDLMFEHALTSIALKDYEAAITTLERMIIFNPDLARAKVELGAAYFRLGAYENARFYFIEVLEKHAPPPEVERRVNGFLSEIGRRTQSSGASGVATFGVTFSSNANLGPPDNQVLLGGQVAVLNDAFVESDDIGFRTTLNGVHFVDLNKPNGDVWLTNLSIFGVHYVDETAGDIDSLSIRTGPRISLDDQNFGPKFRPYVYGDAVRSGNDLLYASVGVGAEYSDTLSEELNLFANAQSAWREYIDRNGFDGSTHRLSLGAAYTPLESTTLSGILFVETDRTDDGFNSNYEIGARFGGVYRYDSGVSLTDRLWSLSGFVGATYRAFDDPNPAIDRNRSRDEIDLRAGLSHVFHLTGGWFVQADADYLLRDSNLPNFDINNFGAALSVGRAF